jgi:L-rhamnose mutarotase
MDRMKIRSLLSSSENKSDRVSVLFRGKQSRQSSWQTCAVVGRRVTVYQMIYDEVVDTAHHSHGIRNYGVHLKYGRQMLGQSWNIDELRAVPRDACQTAHPSNMASWRNARRNPCRSLRLVVGTYAQRPYFCSTTCSQPVCFSRGTDHPSLTARMATGATGRLRYQRRLADVKRTARRRDRRQYCRVSCVDRDERTARGEGN